MIDSRVRLNLDLRETGMPPTVEAKRGDTGRMLLISLSDGGVPYVITDDCWGVFTARKEDGTVLYDPCTIEENVILYTFTEQTCAAAGTMPAEVRLYGSGGKLLTSAAFVLEVRDTVWKEGDRVSEDRMDALDSLVLELTELKSELEGRLEDGALVGPQGEKGEKGDPGETPVKGEDYFTEEDKAQIVDEVLKELPDAGSGEIPTFDLRELGMYPVPLDGGTLAYCHDMTALQILLAQGDVLLTLDVEDVNGDVYPAKAIVRADWLSDQNYYQINTIASNFNTVTGKVNYFMLLSANVFADRILVDVSRLDPSGVLYTPQSLTEAQKTQARENLGITASGQTEGTPVIDLGELGFEPGLATGIIDIDSSTAQALFDKMRKGFVLLKVPVRDGEASATFHFGLCCITEDWDHYFQGMLCYFDGTSWSFVELSMLSGSRLRFMNSGHTPVICNPQTLTEEQKAQARANIGATAVRVDLDGGVLSIE